MYVLRTSHTDWDPERTLHTYWRLTEVEATLRSLKGEMGLRPIRQTKPQGIQEHLFPGGRHIIRCNCCGPA